MEVADTKTVQVENILIAHHFFKRCSCAYATTKKTIIYPRNTELIFILSVRIYSMYAHLNYAVPTIKSKKLRKRHVLRELSVLVQVIMHKV